MTELLWWVFASLAIGGGIGMVTSRNPVSGLLFLVVSFFSLAAIYVILEAHFIAAIQVIVYAGAIMVLFLFVIMLLNLGEQYRSDLRRGAWLVASFGVAGVIGYLLARVFVEGEATPAAGSGALGPAAAEGNVIEVIARPLFREYLVAFELTAVLLLVATVGAVLLAKRRV